MGSVMGKTLSAENGLSPAYDVLGKGAGYELRAYLSYVVAEVQASNESGKQDDCFRTLAKVCVGGRLCRLPYMFHKICSHVHNTKS